MDEDERGVEPEDLPCIVRHYKDASRRYIVYKICTDRSNGREEGIRMVQYQELYGRHRNETRNWLNFFMKLSEGRGPRFMLERKLSMAEALDFLAKYWKED